MSVAHFRIQMDEIIEPFTFGFCFICIIALSLEKVSSSYSTRLKAVTMDWLLWVALFLLLDPLQREIHLFIFATVIK